MIPVRKCKSSSYTLSRLSQVYGTPRSFDIPNTAFNNGNGSYTVQVPFKKDQQMLFTMSDAGGFNFGGSSNVYTVTQSKGGSCNSTDPGKLTF